MSAYVASRTRHGAMWRRLREAGHVITSSWIDEADEGQTDDFGELWLRIEEEIATSDVLVFYGEPLDFVEGGGMKGAFVEVGLALAYDVPVVMCLPGVRLLGRTCRPVGSWIRHPLVTARRDVVTEALAWRGEREEISAGETTT